MPIALYCYLLYYTYRSLINRELHKITHLLINRDSLLVKDYNKTMQFIQHKNHKTKSKEECLECDIEKRMIQEARQEQIDCVIDDMIELRYHRHDR